MKIHVQKVSKRFGAVQALRDVDMQAADGDLLLLTGANGSGKSTLLRILATALAPDEGRYLWNGLPLKQALAEARHAVGFLDADGGSAFYEDLSAEENLAFWAQVYGAGPQYGFSTRLEEVLDAWSLSEKSAQPVRTLSQGMRKRLGLARLMMQGSSLMLLDEPFNGLDSKNTSVLLSLLERWKTRGKVIVVATHQPEILESLATQHLEMRVQDTLSPHFLGHGNSVEPRGCHARPPARSQ